MAAPSSERWVVIEPLLDQALDLAPEGRPAFLAATCLTDPLLRLEVERLLEAIALADSLIDDSAAALASPVLARVAKHQAFAPGQRLGAFQIERELGRGGMATVYLARDVRHDRLVALKVLRQELSATVGAERFVRETAIAARLNHPHILALFDSGSFDAGIDRVLYYAMPYVEGRSLRERLREGSQLPIDEAVDIARQVAEALDHAHQRGIVHRDIKPENVLLAGEHAFVSDFGIARALDLAGADPLTAAGLALGTPAYMSPEQATDGQVDGRSDLYSLGCMLYEMLAGHPPFIGPTAQTVLARQVADPVPPLRTVRATVPPALERVVTQSLAKAPTDRFPTAGAFVEALAAAPTTESESSGIRPSLVTRTGLLIRRHRVRAAVLAGAAAAVTAGVGLAVRSTPARGPTLDRSTVAVLPFTYRGNPELSYLADGIVDLLSTKLDGGAGIHSIDPHALRGFMGSEVATADPQRGLRTADHFGAGRFVLGSIVEAGGRLQVSATVYDERARAQGSIEATASDQAGIFDVADRLARHIVSESQDTPLDVARAADQTTSLPALKAYIEGERDLRAARLNAAFEDYRRASELDTSFALALYRLGMQTGDAKLARERLDRALRHGDRLAENQRGLLQAGVAVAKGDDENAYQMVRAVLLGHPEDVDAWSLLGRLIGRRVNVVGGSWTDARDAFEHVLALDPQNGMALWTLATIAAREGRRADLDSLTQRLLRLNPRPDIASNARGQRAIVLGDSAGLERFVAELRARPDYYAQGAGGYVTFTTGDLTVGRRLWRLVAEPSRSRAVRVIAYITLAKIELTNGRRDAANAELASAAILDPTTALESRAYFALSRFLEAPRGDLVALRDSVRRLSPADQIPDDDGLAEMHRPIHPYLRLYLLGLLSARLGDEGSALRYAGDLERADSSTPRGAFAIGEAQSVRAEVARMRGRPEEALAILERPRLWAPHPDLWDTGDSPFLIRLHERFARAELLHALGRDDAAIPWYRNFVYDLLYTGPANLRLAQIYHARGDRQHAIEHYTRFVELWRDCDPAFRPLVQQARSALDSLQLK